MSIAFTVVIDNKTHHLETHPNEYRSLMALLYDTVCFDEFGECHGMGRCGTCLVEFISIAKPFTALDRNEDTTLSKMGLNGSNTYLSCQIEIDEALNGAVIKVLNP